MKIIVARFKDGRTKSLVFVVSPKVTIDTLLALAPQSVRDQVDFEEASPMVADEHDIISILFAIK